MMLELWSSKVWKQRLVVCFYLAWYFISLHCCNGGDLVSYPEVLWLSAFVNNIWQDVLLAGVKATFWEKVFPCDENPYFITKYANRKAVLNWVYNSDAVQFFPLRNYLGIRNQELAMWKKMLYIDNKKYVPDSFDEFSHSSWFFFLPSSSSSWEKEN